MTLALLVIDVQEALCSGEEECYDIEKKIEAINGVIAKARKAGTPLVFVQHEEENSSLERGSAGWKFTKKLDYKEGDEVVAKKQGNSFTETRLDEILKTQKVDEVVVMGLQTDCCINATTRGAIAEGYNVQLVQNAHSTVDNDTSKAADIISQYNATLATITNDDSSKHVTLVSAENVRF